MRNPLRPSSSLRWKHLAIALLLGLTASATVQAQGQAQGQAQAPAQAPAHAPAKDAEPTVQRSVIEDDSVRIEELRVRGLLQSITVRPRNSTARPYQIVTGQDGRDLSQDRRAAGQRVWSVLAF